MVELGEIEIASTIFHKFDIMSVNLKEENYKRWLEIDKILIKKAINPKQVF